MLSWIYLKLCLSSYCLFLFDPHVIISSFLHFITFIQLNKVFVLFYIPSQLICFTFLLFNFLLFIFYIQNGVQNKDIHFIDLSQREHACKHFPSHEREFPPLCSLSIICPFLLKVNCYPDFMVIMSFFLCSFST